MYLRWTSIVIWDGFQSCTKFDPANSQSCMKETQKSNSFLGFWGRAESTSGYVWKKSSMPFWSLKVEESPKVISVWIFWVFLWTPFLRWLSKKKHMNEKHMPKIPKTSWANFIVTLSAWIFLYVWWCLRSRNGHQQKYQQQFGFRKYTHDGSIHDIFTYMNGRFVC